MKELTWGRTEGSCPPQIGPLSGHLPPWPQLPATPSPGLSTPLRTLARLDVSPPGLRLMTGLAPRECPHPPHWTPAAAGSQARWEGEWVSSRCCVVLEYPRGPFLSQKRCRVLAQAPTAAGRRAGTPSIHPTKDVGCWGSPQVSSSPVPNAWTTTVARCLNVSTCPGGPGLPHQGRWLRDSPWADSTQKRTPAQK